MAVVAPRVRISVFVWPVLRGRDLWRDVSRDLMSWRRLGLKRSWFSRGLSSGRPLPSSSTNVHVRVVGWVWSEIYLIKGISDGGLSYGYKGGRVFTSSLMLRSAVVRVVVIVVSGGGGRELGILIDAARFLDS